jgi:hypothetical protein
MDTIWAIILITTVSGVGGTGLGGLVGACVKRDSQRMVSLLLSFAAGVMLAIVCFDLMPEAIHPTGMSQQMNLLIVIANLVVGYMVVYLLNYLIDRDTDKEVPHIRARRTTPRRRTIWASSFTPSTTRSTRRSTRAFLRRDWSWPAPSPCTTCRRA